MEQILIVVYKKIESKRLFGRYTSLKANIVYNKVIGIELTGLLKLNILRRHNDNVLRKGLSMTMGRLFV